MSPWAAPPALTAGKGLLRSIYARPEFSHAHDPSSSRWPELLERLWRLFTSFAHQPGVQGYALASRVLVLAMAAGVALFGLVRLALRAAPLARTRARAQPGTVSSIRLSSPPDHLATASALAATAPRAALREGLLALLSALEAGGWASSGRIATNRELAAELGARGAPAELLPSATSLLGWYDERYYSLSGVSGEDARAFVTRVARLTQAAGGGSA